MALTPAIRAGRTAWRSRTSGPGSSCRPSRRSSPNLPGRSLAVLVGQHGWVPFLFGLLVVVGGRSIDRPNRPLLVALVRIGRSWRAIRRARRGRAPAADWPEFGAALANLTRDEGWRSLAVGEEGAALWLRRATDDDRPGSTRSGTGPATPEHHAGTGRRSGCQHSGLVVVDRPGPTRGVRQQAGPGARGPRAGPEGAPRR